MYCLQKRFIENYSKGVSNEKRERNYINYSCSISESSEYSLLSPFQSSQGANWALIPPLWQQWTISSRDGAMSTQMPECHSPPKSKESEK